MVTWQHIPKPTWVIIKLLMKTTQHRATNLITPVCFQMDSQGNFCWADWRDDTTI